MYCDKTNWKMLNPPFFYIYSSTNEHLSENFVSIIIIFVMLIDIRCLRINPKPNEESTIRQITCAQH